MPLLAADPVNVLPEQREALEQLVRSRSTPQQLALRARMILHAADTVGVRESAGELEVWPKTVRLWRKRWREAPQKLSVAEKLSDAPRSGAPATYTPEQICAVIAMTCEKPSESERPISHWSQREIADEAMTPKPDAAFDAKCADICEKPPQAAAVKCRVAKVASPMGQN
jgi:putative transposase